MGCIKAGMEFGMKRPAVVLLVIGVLFAQGCTYVPGIKETNLTPLHQKTATRSDIEAVLGKPIASRATEEGSVSLYRYNKGAAGGIEGPTGDCRGEGDRRCLAASIILSPFIWGATPLLYASKRKKQKGFLGVAYVTDRPPTIVELSGSGEQETLLDQAIARLRDAQPSEDSAGLATGESEALSE